MNVEATIIVGLFPPAGSSRWITKEVTFILVQSTKDFWHLRFSPCCGVSEIGKGWKITTKERFDIVIIDHVTSNTGTDFTEKIVIANWDLNKKNQKSGWTFEK